MDERYSEEIKRRVALLRPIDDIFMFRIFKDDIPLTEMMLQRIMGIPSLTVRQMDVQYDIDLRAIGARTLRLDIFATDSNDNAYDIEIQRDDRGAHPKRARYHASAMDVARLKQGQDFTELHEVYVIFITEHDFWKDGKALHVFDRSDTNTGKPLDDGTHIIYVNGQYQANDLIGDLMHDFSCAKTADMRIPRLATKCSYFKDTEEGETKMCQIIEDFAKEYAKEYANSIAINNALKMLKNSKLSLGEIAEYTNLSQEKVASLAEIYS